MPGVEVVSRTQRIIVLPNTAVSIVRQGPPGPVGPPGPQGPPGPMGGGSTALYYIDGREYGSGMPGDGSNETDDFLEAVDATPDGGFLFVPPGLHVVDLDAIVCQKAITLFSTDKFACWLKPSSNGAGAVWTFDLDNASPFGGVRAYYGGGLKNIGFDLSAAPNATALKNAWTNGLNGWMTFEDLYFQGGAVHVDHAIPNCRFERIRMVDAGKFFKINGDTGLELTLRSIDATRATVGTTEKALEVISTLAAGAGGQLRMFNVVFNCLPGTPGVAMNAGVHIESAGASVSLPLFAYDLQVDNCFGPAMKLVGVQDVHVDFSWLNSAAAAGCTVEITGGGNISFTDTDFFGGSGAGAGTFEFLGVNATYGFKSRQNTCRTGPVYRFTGSQQPLEFMVDDWIPGAVNIGQITNNEAKLKAAAARRWDRLWLQREAVIPTEGLHFVGFPGEPAWQNGWINHTALVFYWIDPSGVVHLEGNVQSGAAGAAAFTLPAGWRPSQVTSFNPAGGTVVVQPTGEVQPQGAAITALSGITFRQGG